MTTTSTPIKFAMVSAPSDPFDPTSPERWCVVSKSDAAARPVKITREHDDIDSALDEFAALMSASEHEHIVRRIAALEQANAAASIMRPKFGEIEERIRELIGTIEGTPVPPSTLWSPDDAVKRIRTLENHVRELADALATIDGRGWRNRLAVTAGKIRDRVGILDRGIVG